MMKPTRAPEDITQFQHWVYSFLLRRMTSRLTSRLKLPGLCVLFGNAAGTLQSSLRLPGREAGQLSRESLGALGITK